MTAADKEVMPLVYSNEDHQTWNKLCVRQLELVKDVACKAFWEGWPKLALDVQRLPNPQLSSAHLQQLTGWTLADAQNEYLGALEWFEHLNARRFPATNYIRRPSEIDFTPLPDLFHEYFGHLAFFTDQYFANIAERYGQVYLKAQTQTQQLAISRLWWYSIEFGFIREGDQLKVIGAGLLSSPGELQHALNPQTLKSPFDINRVGATPGAAYSFHNHYFIIDSIQHMRAIIDDYARQEGLD